VNLNGVIDDSERSFGGEQLRLARLACDSIGAVIFR
jgi:hypothetical protein